MGGAFGVVPIDVRGLWDFGRASDTAGWCLAKTYQVRSHLVDIELVPTPGFQHLRTGMARLAAVEYAGGRKASGHVREVRPPDRGFVAAHVEVERTFGCAQRSLINNIRPLMITQSPSKTMLFDSSSLKP